jgi:hypothetical protein
MAFRVRNRTFTDFDQPPRRPAGIRGSPADVFYPEMMAFDLREEFEWMLLGNFEEPGVGRPILYRKLTDIFCLCWDGLTGSPDPNCVYCQGEGFQFTEVQEIAYLAKNFGSVLGGATQIGQQSQLPEFGYSDSNKAIAYMRWDSIPDYERYMIPSKKAPDKLYELKVQDDGSLLRPIIRLDKWYVRNVTPHHGAGGRVEYFELGIEKITT